MNSPKRFFPLIWFAFCFSVLTSSPLWAGDCTSPDDCQGVPDNGAKTAAGLAGLAGGILAAQKWLQQHSRPGPGPQPAPHPTPTPAPTPTATPANKPSDPNDPMDPKNQSFYQQFPDKDPRPAWRQGNPDEPIPATSSSEGGNEGEDPNVIGHDAKESLEKIEHDENWPSPSDYDPPIDAL